MVNVNSHIPFNLYNQTLPNLYDPSSSRSGSEVSRTRYGFPPNYHRSRLAGSGFAVAAADASDASVSPERTGGGRRPSLTGMDPMIVPHRTPTLDVRLVQDPVRSYSSINAGRRGRPRVRAGDGRSGEQPHQSHTDEDEADNMKTPTIEVRESLSLFYLSLIIWGSLPVQCL
jgi:hypothetical protein